MLPENILSILAAALAVQATPLEKRAVVNHDSINPFPETVPNSATGNTFKRFEPYLHIAHGCQSYPAVTANGDVRLVIDATSPLIPLTARLANSLTVSI
jgi:hypothetical protein